MLLFTSDDEVGAQKRRDPRRASLASEAIKSDSGCNLLSVRISIQQIV